MTEDLGDRPVGILMCPFLPVILKEPVQPAQHGENLGRPLFLLSLARTRWSEGMW